MPKLDDFIMPHAPSFCELQTQPQRAFAAIVLALVLIGLVGNFLIMFIILVLKEYKKSVASWYILQLSLADTLFLLTLPFTAASELTGKWHFGLEFCKVKEAILFINYYASIFFLTVMAFDRYLAVTKAFASNKIIKSLRTPVASFVISSVGWVVSILACTPLFMFSKLSSCGQCQYEFPTRYDEKLTGIMNVNNENYNKTNEHFWSLYDTYSQPFFENYFNKTEMEVPYRVQETISGYTCKHPENSTIFEWIYINFIIAFLVPLILICAFYGMIMKAIVKTSSVGNADSQQAYRRRVTLIVLGLVSLFVVSWLPWYTIHIAKLHGLNISENKCSTITLVGRVFAYLNSALNPYFYSFLGTRFRERITRASSRITFRSTTRTRLASRDQRRKPNSSTHSAARGNRVQNNAVPQQRNAPENKKPALSQDEVKSSTTAQKTERTVL